MKSEAAIRGRIEGLKAQIPDQTYYGGHQGTVHLEIMINTLDWVLEDEE